MSSASVVFDRAASYYDATRGFPPGEDKRVAALIGQVGKFSPGSDILEIAIGTGRIALPLAAYVRTVYGVDLSRPMMERLRAKQSGEAIRIAEGDVTRLPFKTASVHGAVAVHIFHLVPNWRDALHEVARVLAPGAMLVHAGGGDTTGFESLEEVIHTQLPNYEHSVGVQHQDTDQFLIDEGWQRVGDVEHYHYSRFEAPQLFIDTFEKRTASRTWSLTDEEIERVVGALRVAIHEQFGDPERTVEVKTSFRAAAYLPPRV